MSSDDDIIILCNGVGPVIRQDTITIPHYEDGICIVAIKFKLGTPEKKKAKTIAKLEKLRYKILEEIEKATGGEITYPS